jgi:hypothetical protein
MKETHPSWGIVSLSHRTSNGHTLFLSPVDAHAEVTLTISRASLHRSEHLGVSPWPEEQIVSVSLSPVQFAELITQPNRGSGVACTLNRVGSERMPDCPPMTDELDDAVTRSEAHGIAETVTLLDGIIKDLDRRVNDRKGLSLTELRDLKKNLEVARMRGSTDLQYWRKEISDRAHKLRGKMATELHATADLIVRNMGLETLRDRARTILPTFDVKSIDVDNRAGDE